jgi:hypothetical protein
MDLLQAGVDRPVIALWLGHESVKTTQIYLEATLAMKEQALAKTSPPQSRAATYRPSDQLLSYGDALDGKEERQEAAARQPAPEAVGEEPAGASEYHLVTNSSPERRNRAELGRTRRGFEMRALRICKHAEHDGRTNNTKDRAC